MMVHYDSFAELLQWLVCVCVKENKYQKSGCHYLFHVNLKPLKITQMEQQQ